MSKLYFCYSENQKRFLAQNGVRYDGVALNPNTLKTMWIYVRGEELDSLLTQWTNNKQKKIYVEGNDVRWLLR